MLGGIKLLTNDRKRYRRAYSSFGGLIGHTGHPKKRHTFMLTDVDIYRSYERLFSLVQSFYVLWMPKYSRGCKSRSQAKYDSQNAVLCRRMQCFMAYVVYLLSIYSYKLSILIIQ